MSSLRSEHSWFESLTMTLSIVEGSGSQFARLTAPRKIEGRITERAGHSAYSESRPLERESLPAFLPLGSSHSMFSAEGVCPKERKAFDTKCSHRE